MINTVAGNSEWLSRWSRRLAGLGLGARCGLLALAVAAAYPVIGGLAWQQFGEAGCLSALVAALVCWFGSTVALLLTGLLSGPQAALLSLLLGMVFRMGLPLAAGLMLSRTSPALAAAGVFGCIVGFYLVTLVAETLLALPLVQGRSDSNRLK